MHTYSPSPAEPSLAASEVSDRRRGSQPVEIDPDLHQMLGGLRTEFEQTRDRLESRMSKLEARSAQVAPEVGE